MFLLFWNDPDNYSMCVWIVHFVQLVQYTQRVQSSLNLFPPVRGWTSNSTSTEMALALASDELEEWLTFLEIKKTWLSFNYSLGLMYSTLDIQKIRLKITENCDMQQHENDYFTLYLVHIFVFCLQIALFLFLKPFLDGSSVRVIISLYVQLIFLFVDGAVSSAIYYTTFFLQSILKLEGTAPNGCLLLAPAEGWWPSATWSWRALWALWIAVLADITGWELLQLSDSVTPHSLQPSGYLDLQHGSNEKKRDRGGGEGKGTSLGFGL